MGGKQKSKGRAKQRKRPQTTENRVVSLLRGAGRAIAASGELQRDQVLKHARKERAKWNEKYRLTESARTACVADLTWEKYQAQTLPEHVGTKFEPPEGEPRFGLVRDITHQLVALRVLVPNGTRFQLNQDTPSGKGQLNRAVAAVLEKARQMEKSRGGKKCRPKQLFHFLLRELNGCPPPNFGLEGISENDLSYMREANENFLKHCVEQRQKLNKEVSKCGYRYPVMPTLDQTRDETIDSSAISRYWVQQFEKGEQKRREKALQHHMEECRKYMGDGFVESLNLNLVNPQSVNINVNKLDEKSMDAAERNELVKAWLDVLAKTNGLAALPAINAQPHAFKATLELGQKIATDAMALAKAEKERDDLNCGVSPTVDTILYGCPWCPEPGFANTEQLKRHYETSLECKTKRDELEKHPALEKKAAERKGNEKKLFQLQANRGRMPAVDAVRAYRQGYKVDNEVYFPAGPIWPLKRKRGCRHFYPMERASAAYESNDPLVANSVLHNTVGDYK